ncbi:MAG: hypothetical protein U0470_02560 [Anaerolineae bacterium]
MPVPAARHFPLTVETHRNHYLFADHFLGHVLPDDASRAAVDGAPQGSWC